MRRAVRLVQALIEDSGDDFDIRDDLGNEPSPFPGWTLVGFKQRENRLGTSVDTDSYTYRNDASGVYMKVYSDFGDPVFDVFIYDENGGFIDGAIGEVADENAKHHAQVAQPLLKHALRMLKDYSISLWRQTRT